MPIKYAPEGWEFFVVAHLPDSPSEEQVEWDEDHDRVLVTVCLVTRPPILEGTGELMRDTINGVHFYRLSVNSGVEAAKAFARHVVATYNGFALQREVRLGMRQAILEAACLGFPPEHEVWQAKDSDTYQGPRGNGP